mgnify:CR=1 FL=1
MKYMVDVWRYYRVREEEDMSAVADSTHNLNAMCSSDATNIYT